MTKPRTPAIAAWAELDLARSFYKASPHKYFDRRLRALLVMLGAESAVDELFKAGLHYKDFTAKDAPEEAGAGEGSDAGRDQYAAVEAVVLLHHVAESMMRLYLAHANRNPFPWLEVAKLTDFREFKKRIAELSRSLDDDGVMADALEVFSYAATPDFVEGEGTEEGWNDHASALRSLLRIAIATLLDEAHVYNATKHGMAVLSSELSISLSAPDEPELGVNSGGQSLQFLETVIAEDGQSRWSRTTVWVDVTKNLALIHLMTKMMESLWKSARAHYGVESLAQIPHILRSEMIEAVLRTHLEEFTITRMSEQLPVAEESA